MTTSATRLAAPTSLTVALPRRGGHEEAGPLHRPLSDPAETGHEPRRHTARATRSLEPLTGCQRTGWCAIAHPVELERGPQPMIPEDLPNGTGWAGSRSCSFVDRAVTVAAVGGI